MILNNIIGFFKGRYTIGELMSIDPTRQQKASGCKVTLVDTFFSIKEESLEQKFRSIFATNIVKVFYITLKLDVISDSGNSHTVFVQLEPDFSIQNPYSNKIRIFCDCSDFKYRSAYILGKRDSLFANDFTKISLGQSLSDSPKNNSKTTNLCKHSYAALSWVINNYNLIMNTL